MSGQLVVTRCAMTTFRAVTSCAGFDNVTSHGVDYVSSRVSSSLTQVLLLHVEKQAGLWPLTTVQAVHKRYHGIQYYCNALLYGTFAVYIARLQRIHNMSARLIMRSPRSDSATLLLHELHRLPVLCRINFKLLVFTYKSMHNDAPVYLCELVCPCQPTRTLRNANNNMLEVKRTRTKAGDCSFAIAAGLMTQLDFLFGYR